MASGADRIEVYLYMLLLLYKVLYRAYITVVFQEVSDSQKSLLDVIASKSVQVDKCKQRSSRAEQCQGSSRQAGQHETLFEIWSTLNSSITPPPLAEISFPILIDAFALSELPD